MTEILTNGAAIKQRILSEIENAQQVIYLAMAWFTDRDIAKVIIDAQKRNVFVDIILSSNIQNETVKSMFIEAGISVHAFETGDERGLMHHKFCLIDHKLTINGSYNYSVNASTNNVENIQISEDINTHNQFLKEFERMKHNIDHQINLNSKTSEIMEDEKNQNVKYVDVTESFSQYLSNLVFSSANITTENYRKQGFENAKDSSGNLEIFKVNYEEIKEQIRSYATNDTLTGKKNIMIDHIDTAFENKKSELESEKMAKIGMINSEKEFEVKQVQEQIKKVKEKKAILETGNSETGDKGILQLKNEIDKIKLERDFLESSLVIRKYWSVGTFVKLFLGLVLFFYLSMFFASAIYKVFFEGNIIRASLQAGLQPPLPQVVDANAIIKIFMTQGWLFGLLAMFFFLIPVSISNIKLLREKEDWVNTLCFWIGVLVFDIAVSVMVTLNIDEIKSLTMGQQPTMQIWEVVKHGEFYLIFVFGMLPLVITHFLIESLVKAYHESQRDRVNYEKSKQIELLDKKLLDLNTEKQILDNKMKDLEAELEQKNKELELKELEINTLKVSVERFYTDYLKNITRIYEDYISKIKSGKIFTEEILNSISTAYKTGFIEYLPELYAEREVANRVRQIETLLTYNK